MANRKNNLFVYGLIALFVSFASVVQVSAAEYENYFGITMTNEEYNTLLNLGFSDDEIYYMDEQTYLENKDLDATLVSKEAKYYKTVYTDLNGNSYSTEITKDEYDNQSLMDTRATVTTEYKTMVTTISQNSDKYRFKVSVAWNKMPSTKSYDIIGVGFEQTNIYIDSSVYFNYYYCNTSGSCATESYYYNKKKTTTGGSAAFKFPDSVNSFNAVLYYDVSKNTTSTVTSLKMCGDYSHATTAPSVGNISDYDITINGLELGGSIISYYDAIPCALSTWDGSW